MKQTFFKYALLLILPVGMLFASCSKDDDDDPAPEPTGIAVKCGTITYNDNTYFAFKDYGKMYVWGNNSAGSKIIVDVNAAKVYMVNLDSKTYLENSGAANVELYSGSIVADEVYWKAIPGVSKSTSTIAGKSCTVYSWSDSYGSYKYGVWSGLIFKVSDDEDNFEAKSFSDAEPAASMFSIDGLTKITGW